MERVVGDDDDDDDDDNDVGLSRLTSLYKKARIFSQSKVSLCLTESTKYQGTAALSFQDDNLNLIIAQISQAAIVEDELTLSARVINIKFPLQPHQKYNRL